jgi:gliding motility-associated-like protein
MIITAAMLICLNKTMAQVQVSIGSAHTYSVSPLSDTASYIYHWSSTGGTSSDFGTSDTAKNIVWEGPPGLYTVSEFPEKVISNCFGDTQTLTVSVLNINIVWTNDSSTQCPNTENQTGDFSIIASYTGVEGAWSFKYCIDGIDTFNVNISSGNTSLINIPGFENSSDTIDEIHTIRIVSLTTPDNYTVFYTGTEHDAASRLYTVKVEPAPGTFWIVPDTSLFSKDSVSLCAGLKGVKYQVSGDSGSIFHWIVNGGNIVSDSNTNTIIVNWSLNPGNYSVSVQGENKSGCMGNTNKLHVNLLPIPVINLGNNKSICEGDQVTLVADSGLSSGNTYMWQDGSTGPVFIAKNAGLYWVVITSSNGCSFSDSVILLVNPLPIVNLGKDTMLCNDDDVVLDACIFGATYLWNTGAITQTITASENEGLIWVKVTDNNGCIGYDSIQILKCTGRIKLNIPKAFSPYHGTTNNHWIIGGSENYPNMTVKIYDRWGILIFESDVGYLNPWDGTSGGKSMPMDAYYYLIHLGDGSKDLVGSVTLIR